MQFRPFIWSVSLTLTLLCVFVGNINLELGADEPFFIGRATADAVSVNQRVQVYYKFILAGSLAFLLFYFLFQKLLQRTSKEHPFLEWIDPLMLLSSLLSACVFFEIGNKESIWFLMTASFFLYLFGLNKRIRGKNFSAEFAIGLGLIVLVNHLLFHGAVIGLIVSAGLFIWWLSSEKQRPIIYPIVSFAICSPIIAFLSIEASIFFVQLGLNLNGYLILGIIFGLICLSYFMWRRKNQTDVLYKRWIPLALVGITICQVYSPIIDQPNEFFESANILNPIMQFHQFGELPIIDNLSSHLFSDFSLSWIYTSLFGFDGTAAPLIYVNLIQIFNLLIIYYFLRAVLGNKLELTAILFFVPFLFFVIPPYFAFVLLPIIPMIRFFQTNEQKRLYHFAGWIAFLLLWRLDLAVSLISGGVVVFVLWWFLEKDLRSSFKKLVIFSILLFGIVGGCLFLAIKPHLQEALHYFGANQAHGLSDVTYFRTALYYLDYFILPIVLVLIGLYTLFGIRSTTNKALDWTIILLIAFYVFNLQRGLVRHSFMEQKEIQIASFSWLILFLFGLKFLKDWKMYHYTIVFFFTTGIFFTIQPVNQAGNRFESQVSLSLKNLPDLKAKTIQRVKPSEEFTNSNRQIISFLKTELKSDETFLDFSNHPLLYYYSKRNVPSYFNQFLQNVVDDYLQDEALKEIRSLNVPIVILKTDPETYLDGTDGIPNKVRYYQLAAYIFANYEPYKTIDGFVLWKAKKEKTRFKTTISYAVPTENWDLGYLPYYWNFGRKEKETSDKLYLRSENGKNLVSMKPKLRTGDFLRIKLTSGQLGNGAIKAGNWSLLFKLKRGTHNYLIPIGYSENAVLNPISEFELNTDCAVHWNDLKLVHLAR